MKTLNLNITNLILNMRRMVINTLCILTNPSGFANFRFITMRSY